MTLEAEQAAAPAEESLPSLEDMQAADTAPEPSPAPEPQAEAPAPAETPAPEPQRVPLPTFLEEKKARKAAEDEARRYREQLEEGNKRLATIMERLTAPQQPQQQIPAFEQDPANHLRAKVETTEERIARLEAERDAGRQQSEFVNRYRAAAAEFASQAPDFGDAYKHAIAALRDDAALFGMSAEMAEAQIVQNAFAAGRNPAQALYDFAKRRGFSASAPQSQAATAEKVIETLERGAQAAKGAASAPGRSPAPTLSMEGLASMSSREFDALMAKDPDAIKRVLAGA